MQSTFHLLSFRFFLYPGSSQFPRLSTGIAFNNWLIEWLFLQAEGSFDYVKEIFQSIPANLTHLRLLNNSLSENVSHTTKENLTEIIEENEKLLVCNLAGLNFFWKFEEITKRNKKLKNEARFKVMKVAPRVPEQIEENSWIFLIKLINSITKLFEKIKNEYWFVGKIKGFIYAWKLGTNENDK